MYVRTIMDFKSFEEKFEEILEEELEAFDIDLSIVEIGYTSHSSLLNIPSPIDPDHDECLVRMEVVAYEGEMPDTDDYIDRWFRTNEFIYIMISRSDSSAAKIDMMDPARDTIASIAKKIFAIFKNSRE